MFQVESTAAMQNIAPRVKAIQEEYKGRDQQEMQIKVGELYKQAGVNPLAGCLPTLATLPVWIGLYRLAHYLSSPLFSNAVRAYKQAHHMQLKDSTKADVLEVLCNEGNYVHCWFCVVSNHSRFDSFQSPQWHGSTLPSMLSHRLLAAYCWQAICIEGQQAAAR